jgi:hypothetical protein
MDNQSQRLPRVRITVLGLGSPLVQVTDAEGRFFFPFLGPGNYTVKAQLEGFVPVERQDVEIREGEGATLEITLEPAIGE